MSPARIQELIDAFFAGTISSGDQTALEEQLLANPAARSMMWKGGELQLLLRMAAAEKSEAGSATSDTDSAPEAQSDDAVRVTEAHATPVSIEAARRRSAPRPFSISLMTAAAVIGLLITVMAFIAPPFYRAFSGMEEIPESSMPVVVAELAGLHNAVWANGQIGATLGAHLPHGHRMELQEGLALVHFYSGADATIEGPATFIIQAEDVLQLESGRVSVIVPPEAVGFRVASTDAEAVDLGTQFGMITDRTRTEMHVFAGRVEAHLFDSEGQTVYTTQLNAGQSLSWSSKTRIRQIAEADPKQFVSFPNDEAVAKVPDMGPQQKAMLVSKIGSERATTGAGSKLVTFQGKTHFVWQDYSTRYGYLNRVASYDHATDEISRPTTLHRGKSPLERPMITVDQQGYLHVIVSGHNTPMWYRRSEKPHDTSAWTDPVPVGSGTYPDIICAADGTLCLVMRSSNNWDGLDYYIKPPESDWKPVAKLVKRHPQMHGFGAFASGMAWGPDHKTLHLVTDFYEGTGVTDNLGLNQAVCAMRSDDLGKTWRRADGTPVEIPARPKQLDLLALDTEQRHEPHPPAVISAQGNIVVDPQGRPHVLYISHSEEPGAVIHATTNEDGAWRQTKVDVVKQRYPDRRPIQCRGAMTIDEDGKLYALLELSLLSSGWNDGKPTRANRHGGENKKLVWLTSSNGGKTFHVQSALADEMDFHHANIERPTGFNRIPGGQLPPFLFFDGDPESPAEGQTVHNNVYLVVPK